MKNAQWIWGEETAPNTYCYFRGKLLLPEIPLRGTLRVFADSRYQLWVNGVYVGQGPTPFKRPYLFVDDFDVARHLRGGANVVALLVHYHGVNHCTYTKGPPGLIAELVVDDSDGNTCELTTNTGWKVWVSRAYARKVPRRTWATAWCEYYDARAEPTGWETPDFDDVGWRQAREIDPGTVQLLPRITAPLAEHEETAQSVVGTWHAQPGIPVVEGMDVPGANGPPVKSLTAWLDEEPLEAWSGTDILRGPLKIDADNRGLALTVDFGQEIAGQVEMEVDCPAGVTIDLCPCENLRDGRPWCHRKGGDYAKRYVTRNGRQRWRTFGYDGFRYLHLVIRGPHPEVTIHRLGAWRRESALPIRATFESDDPVVNRIWEISCHTVRVCSQDVHVDCPTREQTSAWGDHVWSGYWAAFLTGDTSALRHLLLTGEHAQGLARPAEVPPGQLPCYAFSEVDSGLLYDYSLIFVWGIWLYLTVSGDRDLARRLVPVTDRVLDWYRQRLGPTGLVELDCEAARRRWQDGTAGEKGLVFIDHPGLGWHHHPGSPLDRRGINAALNFFFIHALEAQARVLEHLGEDGRARQLEAEAARLREAADKLFYDPQKGVYADGFDQGQRLAQVSQQTNALAVTSGVCPVERAPAVLARVMDPQDPGLCRCGTYFWLYLAAALCQAGLHERMWGEVVRLWNEMAEKGATTWWETFLGDELDSLCHIWSCVPGFLILSEILGVQPAAPGFAEVTVRPRPDLLPTATGTVPLPDGEVRIAWRRQAPHECEITIHPLTDRPALLSPPPGWQIIPEETTSISLTPHTTNRIWMKRLDVPGE